MIRLEKNGTNRVSAHRSKRCNHNNWIKIDMGGDSYLLKVSEALTLANNLVDTVEALAVKSRDS